MDRRDFPGIIGVCLDNPSTGDRITLNCDPVLRVVRVAMKQNRGSVCANRVAAVLLSVEDARHLYHELRDIVCAADHFRGST